MDKIVESIGVDGIVGTVMTLASQPFGLLDYMAKCADPQGRSVDIPFVFILLTDHLGVGQVGPKHIIGIVHAHSLGIQSIIRFRQQDVIQGALETYGGVTMTSRLFGQGFIVLILNFPSLGLTASVGYSSASMDTAKDGF